MVINQSGLDDNRITKRINKCKLCGNPMLLFTKKHTVMYNQNDIEQFKCRVWRINPNFHIFFPSQCLSSLSLLLQMSSRYLKKAISGGGGGGWVKAYNRFKWRLPIWGVAWGEMWSREQRERAKKIKKQSFLKRVKSDSCGHVGGRNVSKHLQYLP